MLHILTPHKYIVGDWILLPCITTFYSYSIMAVSLMIYCMIVPDIVRSFFYMSTVETNKRLFIIIIKIPPIEKWGDSGTRSATVGKAH